VVASDDEDGVIEQSLALQLFDDAAHLHINPVGGVGIAVPDQVDLREQVGFRHARVIDVLGIRLIWRIVLGKVVAGVGGLEKVKAHKRSLCFALLQEFDQARGVVLVALPGWQIAICFLQLVNGDSGKQGLVKFGVGKARTGAQVKLVAQLNNAVHQQRAAAGAEKTRPVGTVQPVEHAEQALPGTVARGVVAGKVLAAPGQGPGIGHGVRIELIPAQGFRHQPDNIGGLVIGSVNSVEGHRLAGILEPGSVNRSSDGVARCGLNPEAGRQTAKSHCLEKGVHPGGIEDGTILFQVGDTVAGALGHQCQQPQPGNRFYQRAAGKRHPGDPDTERYQHQLDDDNTGDEQCHR